MSQNAKPRIIDISGEDQRDAKKLSALFDEEIHSSPALRKLLLAVVALIFVFVGWSFVTDVEELAKARGELKPTMNVQKIQTLEGGLLEQIAVKRDDFVNQGDLIASFLGTSLSKDTTQVETRLSALQINLERLGALVDNRSPDFSQFDQYPNLVNEARELYFNQAKLNQQRIVVKQQQLNRLQTELAGHESQIPATESELATARTILAREEAALKQHLVPALEVDEARNREAAADIAVKELKSRVNQTKRSIKVAEAELSSLGQEIIQESRKERNETLEKIRELNAEMGALQQRTREREIYATVTGYIKNVPETAIGSVIQPGGIVAEIVPSEGGVYMEARIQPRDVGFVKVGQQALVKIDSYDFSRFGAVKGKVNRISPSSFRNERDGSVYYVIEIKLDQQFVGDNKNHNLIPGMTGEVDVVTGQKTVFQYIAKPVFTGLNTAFSER